jgi:hypothetical protein
MKYTLWMAAERFKYLDKAYLSIDVLHDNGEMVKFELTINNEYDLLYLFNNGVEYGLDLSIKIRREAI